MTNSYERLTNAQEKIEKQIAFAFQSPHLLFLTFIHRSYVNENKQVKEHNERLEFLGDSVLGLIVAEYLYNRFPTMTEGHLSQLRARLVDATTCSHFFAKLGLQEFILLGKGESSSEGRGKESIAADAFEALIGAIYLDSGYLAARDFFLDHFEKEIEAIVSNPSRNFKAELQDYSQRKYQKPPLYRVIKEEGPDHSKTFTVSVTLGEEVIAEGAGLSKKEAEQMAAEMALQKIEGGNV